MPDEMVEKVARAIWDKWRARPDTHPGLAEMTWERLTDIAANNQDGSLAKLHRFVIQEAANENGAA